MKVPGRAGALVGRLDNFRDRAFMKFRGRNAHVDRLEADLTQPA